jgi:hypothetical protein
VGGLEFLRPLVNSPAQHNFQLSIAPDAVLHSLEEQGQLDLLLLRYGDGLGEIHSGSWLLFIHAL